MLEASGSVGDAAGWTPLPILAERDGAIVAAAPAYLKSHSQGEYVFDHGWAEAWERSGQAYYPKLQVAVPFTPVPGRRLLGERGAILAALEAVTVQNGLSSAHVTFCDEDDLAAGEARGWLRREGIQYHWFNRDYASFDDFLGRAVEPQAQGDPQGARRGVRGARHRHAARRRDRARAHGGDVAFLPGHRQPQMGPALSHAASGSTGSSRRWARRSC